MRELHLPWLEISILLPLAGAFFVGRLRDPVRARQRSVLACGLTLLCSVAAWEDFTSLHAFEAHDRWDLVTQLLGRDLLVIDELSAPLLPLSALLYLLTVVATLRTQVRRFTFAGALVSESILLASLSCRDAWILAGLLGLGTLPPLLEMRQRGQDTRVFTLHMGLFLSLLVLGLALLPANASANEPPATREPAPLAAVLLLTAAVLLRSGVVPVHCWLTDLFEKATFGAALLFVTPILGAYAAMRLVLPIAPDWILRAIALLSLATALYAACMTLIQRDTRRFFCYLFLSNSSLVLVGMETVTPIGLTGALCVWLSVGMALAGFGLTLRCLEARVGRMSLTQYHGLYDEMPTLAAFFLLMGLASIGFPGTIGFIGSELIVDGAVTIYPLLGTAVVFVGALNGIAVLHAYFRLFTGTRYATPVSLVARRPERFAVLALTLLVIGGGIYPQPGVASRYHAAMELVRLRGSQGEIPAATSGWQETPTNTPLAMPPAGPSVSDRPFAQLP